MSKTGWLNIPLWIRVTVYYPSNMFAKAILKS